MDDDINLAAHVEAILNALGIDLYGEAADGAGRAATHIDTYGDRFGNNQSRRVDLLTHLIGVLVEGLVAARGKLAVEEFAELRDLTLDHDDVPFFSEIKLYDLLGKEDARIVLSRLRSLGRALGAGIH